MLTAYLNYPNPKISVYPGVACSEIKKKEKKGLRQIHIDIDTISMELLRFQEKEYKFAAMADFNDMWLEIEFNDLVFESAVLEYVRVLLAKHYTPFASVEIKTH